VYCVVSGRSPPRKAARPQFLTILVAAEDGSTSSKDQCEGNAAAQNHSRAVRAQGQLALIDDAPPIKCRARIESAGCPCRAPAREVHPVVHR